MANKNDNSIITDDIEGKEKTFKFTLSSTPIKLVNAELVALWERTEPISSKNPNVFRLDPAEAIIKLSEFGKKTAHGWVVQPIDLEHALEQPDINNLVAFHWMNGESRIKSSKKNQKNFTTAVTRVTDPLSDDNMKKEKSIPNKVLEKQTTSALWSKKERKGFKSKT